MAAQKGQTRIEWPRKTISFAADEEMECWLTEYAEQLYGPNGRSELLRRIVAKYRRAVSRKRPELAVSSMQQAILSQEGEC